MESTLSNKAMSRNHGIDIIRIVAMCMVVAMHTMMHNINAIRLSCSPGPRIMICFFCVETFICVNLFILTTGWLHAGRMPKFHRVIERYQGVAVVPAVLCSGLAVYTIGMMTDAFRLLFFRFLRLESRFETLGNWIFASACRWCPSGEVS